VTQTLTAYASEQLPLGFFRVFATPPGSFRREITLFRGAPTIVSAVTTSDPFTDTTAQLSMAQITPFDIPGAGDLEWLVPYCDIDIVFQNTGGYDFDWTWEGYIASYSFSLDGQSTSFTLDLKGAFYGLDDYLAIPSFPSRPIPYEILIAQAFDQDAHPAHLGKFLIQFPVNWPLTVPPFKDPAYLSMLKPWGVATGMPWTGITSRSTGSWEPLLTGFVQSLLTVMFAHGGAQWSVRNLGHRRPELYLRRIPDADDDSIIDITLGAPGVALNGTRDYTQRAGVIYGSGTDFAGINFSNIEVSPDGKTTYFKPFAWDPQMWPRKSNPNFNPLVKPKETMITFQSGVDEVAAAKVAQGQYQRFAEPGITGDITLSTDPRTTVGALVPRLLIKGGATIRINGLFGVRDGVLAHVTQSNADFTAMTNTLTYDTKYRDVLTVDEVRARTRDALAPLRSLQVGKYSTTIQDLILPWSYSAGSGIIPTPAKEFFNEKLPQDAEFPYEDFTTQFPPSNPAYKPWYIQIGPTDTDNANHNWSSTKRNNRPDAAIMIRMAASGSIRLTQLCAYDKDGHVMPVKFHLSVYYLSGVFATSMPEMIPQSDPHYPPYLKAMKVNGDIIPTTYQTIDGHAQNHPFYRGSWEKVQPDGSPFPWAGDPQLPDPSIIVGWGNYYEPAGYYPGRFSGGNKRSGMLQDDTGWDWDLVAKGYLNPDPTQNVGDDQAGCLFIMIYCDDQFDESVYFLGRFIRLEPGQSK